MNYKCSMEENTILMQRILEVFEVADLVSDGIYLSDKNGVIISVNKGYSRITGIEAEDVVGKQMQRVLDEKYLTGEYVVLLVETLKDVDMKPTTNNKESYITEKPIAVCRMVLEQKKEASVMGTINV